MLPSSLPKGVVVNTYGEHPKNLLSRLVYWQIRTYQRRKYPHSTRTEAIHSMLHIGNGQFLSVQHPRAIITELQLDPGCKFTVWKYEYLEDFGEASWQAFDQAVREIVGTPYDYGQLIDILVHQLFGWLPEKLNLFDFSRKRKVCSVAVHAVLVRAWQETPTPIPTFPHKGEKGARPERPLGKQYIEHTCPADFENQETFAVVVDGSISTPPR